MSKKILNENLRTGDLENFVSEILTIDHYKSKMGEDRDIVVIGFVVKEKYPAMDLMEFVEKGYKFILDADMSAGEEKDGVYQVFVELERTPKLPSQIKEMMSGISTLCNSYDWKFKYQKSTEVIEVNEQTIIEHVPLTPVDYEYKILEHKKKDIQEFFNQGATNVTVDNNNNLTFSKPYAGNLEAKFISIGDFESVKESLEGPLCLDENSNSEILFLNKYLGNYEIHKIDNKFLIKNQNQGVIIEKTRW